MTALPGVSHLETRCSDASRSSDCNEPCQWHDGKCTVPLQLRWQEALLRRHKANALRRARDFEAAASELSTVLKLVPHYTAAWSDLGMLYLDDGKPTRALDTYKTILHINREFEDLDNWIVLASAEVAREKAVQEEALAAAGHALPDAQTTPEVADDISSLTNHYTMLELCHDFDESELRKAFRRAGRAYHPDKVSSVYFC